MNLDLVGVKTVSNAESEFRSTFKASIVMTLIGTVTSLSLIIYFTAWLKLSTTYDFFMSARGVWEWIAMFLRYYWFAFKAIETPFAIAIGVMVLSGLWGSIILYRYLTQSGKSWFGVIFIYLSLWAVFLTLPVISYLVIFPAWVALYHYALSRPVLSVPDVKIKAIKISTGLEDTTDKDLKDMKEKVE